jgi:hypothetical protein
MVDESEPPANGSQVSPAVEAFLKARATGEYPDGEKSLPPEMIRRRDEWRKFATELGADVSTSEQAGEASSTQQELSSRIGPQNPDHPAINRKPGGLGPT